MLRRRRRRGSIDGSRRGLTIELTESDETFKETLFMRNRFSGSMITVAVVAAAVSAVISVSVTRTEGQATRPARVGGKPNLTGIWQANNEANWDLQAHAARAGAVTQQGVYPYEYARVPAAAVLGPG